MKVTEFISESTPKWLPFQDSSRLYTTEHDVAMHGYGTSPLRGTTASLYDRVQRRWYQLNIDTSPDNGDPESWLTKILLHYIHEQSHCNVITITNGHAKLSLKPNVGRPIRPPVISSSSLPIADYHDVVNKTYYDMSVDTCLWNGVKYMYKQLEFDEDIPRLQREVRCRERLHSVLQPESLSPHGICPISALVVDGKPPRLCGFLMPDVGSPLIRVPTGALGASHLMSLLETLKCLRAAGVVHGDICERNVCVDAQSIHLIDFGELAPDYINDIVATGKLFERIGDRLPFQERGRIGQAAIVLVNREDLDGALSILSSQD